MKITVFKTKKWIINGGICISGEDFYPESYHMIPLPCIIILLRCKCKTTGENRILCQITYFFPAPAGRT